MQISIIKKSDTQEVCRPEKEHQNNQYCLFKKSWKKYFPEKDNLGNKIMTLKYDNFYNVNKAFLILEQALQICTFLHEFSKSKPPQDTEKIIITTFVSCAEAIYRINKPSERINENLVKGFFKPVKPKIKYKIRGNVDKADKSLCKKCKKIFSAVETLYLIRNDYIHNGNFIGSFFLDDDDNFKKYKRNFGKFYFLEKGNKVKLISARSECCLTYEEFKKIFLEAFIKNIKNYYKKINEY